MAVSIKVTRHLSGLKVTYFESAFMFDVLCKNLNQLSSLWLHWRSYRDIKCRKLYYSNSLDEYCCHFPCVFLRNTSGIKTLPSVTGPQKGDNIIDNLFISVNQC